MSTSAEARLSMPNITQSPSHSHNLDNKHMLDSTYPPLVFSAPKHKDSNTRLTSIDPVRIAAIMPSLKQTTDSSSQNIDFNKIFKLFTGKHTSKLYERHVAVVEKLVKIYHDGITSKDLVSVANVLVLASEKIKLGGTELIQPLTINISLKEMNESSKVCESITYMINSLSSILALDDTKLEHITTEAVFAYSGGRIINPDDVNTHRIVFSLKKNDPLFKPKSSGKHDENEIDKRAQLMLECASKSNAVDEISKLLLNSPTVSKRVGLLKCLICLSKSETCVIQLVDAGSIQTLCNIIEENQTPVTFYAIEILWNAIASSSASQVSELLGTTENLAIFKELFDDLALNSHRQANKQMRNDLLTLFTSILTNCKAALPAFVETNLLDSTSGNDDFEFKRLLITLASKMIDHLGMLSSFLENGILKFMMAYLVSESTNPTISSWSDSQLRILQGQILGLLSSIVPRISREFRASDGYNHLKKFLDHTIHQGQLPTASRIDVAREHHTVLNSLLGVVLRLTEIGPTAKKTLASLNIFTNLLNLLDEPNQPIQIWCTSLMICSSLCQGYKANKTEFGDCEGVKKIIPFLKYRSAEHQIQESVIFSVVECVWGVICGNCANEECFLQNQGISLMLDILENTTLKMRRHILGCLLDLLENPKCIYHVLNWKMQQDVNKGIEHLLVEIWNGEEARLQVSQNQSGFINKNHNCPLLDGNQPKVDLAMNKIEQDGGRAIQEIQENLRAKVYSMFFKLGFERFHDSLSTQEQIKLAMISKYLDFKIGEVWLEIADELKFEGIRPVSPDQDCINTVHAVIKKKAEGVYQRQSEIQRKADEIKKKQETLFYEDMRIREILRAQQNARPQIESRFQRKSSQY
ncbi:hypothetical protein BDEG_24442 [Batrachochytrium dendrobatidis JEL423]|uniref:Cilia- and flagella-associated protein 69 ARM repeats domain-containing protein n=1 Tax=Batrachochytrium dendrobatidis (strain JEL423) TaxID=403673 RepID=A0A177WLP2_BATDL|nr:hypothetical protein BDEG_24442 [Batrachochytrium dendrobatidis JEL423]